MRLQKIFSIDIHQIVYKHFLTIDKFYLSTFLWLFFIQNTVFILYTTNFLFGNHDWNQVYPLNYFDFLGHGRWFLGIAAHFNGGHTQPIIHMIVGSCLLSLSSILICIYLEIEKKYLYYLSYGLLFLISPYILGILYFVQSVVPFSLALLLSVISLHTSTHSNIYIKLLSILCTLTMLATYGNALTTCIVVFLCKVTLDSVFWDGKFETLKQKIKIYISTVICTTTGILLFGCSVYTLKAFNKIPAGAEYGTRIIDSSLVIQNFINTAQFAFTQLWKTQPFLPATLKYSLLLLCIMAILILLFNSTRKASSLTQNFARVFFVLFSFISIIIATKLPFYMSDILHFAHTTFRFSFFGIPFLYAFCGIVCIMHSKTLIKSISTVIVVFVIYNSAIQDFQAQKFWKTSMTLEYSLFNRILKRIEDHENFDFSTKYTYLTLGSYTSFGSQLLNRSQHYDFPLEEFIMWPSPMWGPAQLLHHLEPRLQIVDQPNIHLDYLNLFDSYASYFEKYHILLKNSRPWPHPSSVHVIDDTIIVIMDQKYLDKALSLPLKQNVNILFSNAKITLGNTYGIVDYNKIDSVFVHPGESQPTVITFDTSRFSSLAFKANIPLESKKQCGAIGGDVNITFVGNGKHQVTHNVIAGESKTIKPDLSQTNSLTMIVDPNGVPYCDWLTLTITEAEMQPK